MIFPYNCYTHYSIQKAFCHMDQLVKRAHELKVPALGLTDMHSVSGVVDFLQEIAKANKKSEHKVRPVIGCTLRILAENDEYDHVVVLCKNKRGWLNLVKILGETKANKKVTYVTADAVSQNNSDLIAITPANISGKYHFSDSFTHEELAGVPVYYVEKDDILYQRILICSQYKVTMASKERINEIDPDSYTLFFEHDGNYLRTDWENEESLKLLNLIEDFSIFEQPKIPTYLVNGKPLEDPDEYIKELCRKGWVEKGLNNKTKGNPTLKEVYVSRIKNELDTFKEANLANYMLIVRDFMQYAKSKGKSCGLRGSAVGCLVSYLIGISDIDPVCPDPTLPYNPQRELLFSRFFNRGRLSEGHISLADVDVDFPISFRESMIEYAKKKYGHDCVAQISTFSKMDGKAVIKEVFRVMNPVPQSFQVANTITKAMIETSKIQDALEEIREDDPKYTVIHYCIDNIPEVASYYDEYKEIFDIAIKLANTIRGTGKHAAGIVIASQPLSTFVPMIPDPKTGESLIALDFVDVEQLGAVKYDFLGVAAYEKIDVIVDMVNRGLDAPELPINVEVEDYETSVCWE